MKFWRIVQMTLMVLALAAFVAGCSTTPPPSPDDSSQAATSTTTDMTQGADVKGVSDQPLGSEPVADHMAVSGLQRIHFEFDQFTLTDEARTVLANNATYLKANSGLKVVIEGHCDDRGSDEYNLALGERRAMAAKNYLVSLGISGSQLSIISYGEEKPLMSGSGEEVWAQNRRAEFKAVR